MTLRGEQRMKTVVDFLRSMRACVNGEHVVGTTKRSEDNLDDAIHGLRCKENASTLIDWYINNAWSRVLARFLGEIYRFKSSMRHLGSITCLPTSFSIPFKL